MKTLILSALVAVWITCSLHATPFNVNIITNPGGEAGSASVDGQTVVAIPGWTTTGNFTVVTYGSPAFPGLSDPGPSDRGDAFFFGGPRSSLSTATQSIDISDIASFVDTGRVAFRLSGYLGGFEDQDDNALLSLLVEGSVGATLDPVLSLDRNNATGLLFREASGTIPAGTRTIQLNLVMTRVNGSDNDGYADNVSLILEKRSSGNPVPDAGSTGILMAVAAAGIASVRRSMAV